jgi:CRISPR system Cascade subunit CasB
MPEPSPFIAYLQNLAEEEERGALAALRRGLGQPPGTVAAMYPYVVRWLPDALRPWQEAAYYLVAALFALHPDPAGAGNLGASFRLAEGKEERTGSDDERVPAVERRFTALLAAHPDDLPGYLRQAIGFLRSRQVPVGWQQLFEDIFGWGHPSRYVQREWARAYWGRVREQQSEPKE